MSSELNKRWMQGLDEEERQNFRLAWSQSVTVRERLQEILADLIEENAKARIRLEELDNPNWHIKQVHYNTKEKTLLEVSRLL